MKQDLGTPREMQGHLEEVVQMWRKVVDVIRFRRVPHAGRDAWRHCVDTWDQWADSWGWGGKQGQSLQLAGFRRSSCPKAGREERTYLYHGGWVGAEHLES